MTDLVDSTDRFSVAIIIAVYNGAQTLGRTLDSIARQTVKPAQVIVMDGGSKDGTQDLLARRGDVVTCWESEPDKGIYDAWNKGLDRVRADWVIFLGSDDFFWNDRVLETYRHEVRGIPPRTPYVYGRLVEVDEEGQPILSSGVPWEQLKKDWFSISNIPHPGMLHRHASLFVNRRFDHTLKIAGDYELLRQPLLQHDPVFLDVIVAGAQTGGVSTNPLSRWKSVKEWGDVLLRHEGRRTLRWYRKWYWENIRRAMYLVLGERLFAKVRGLKKGGGAPTPGALKIIE